jgi:hypothetical protein
MTEVRVISSILNLPPRAAMTWSAEQHRRYLRDTGYIGITYYPLDNRLAFQIARGERADDLVAAFQQPWREKTRARVLSGLVSGVVQNPRTVREPLMDAAMNMSMPHINRGLEVIGRVQEKLGTSLLRPIVVHPQGQMFGDALADMVRRPNKRRDYHEERQGRQLGEFQWQPTVEWAVNRRVMTDNPEQLVDNMIGLAEHDGLGRAAFDTNHAQAVRRGMQFSNPVAMVARFAARGMLGSFEFAAQPNLGGDVEDVKKILDGNIGGTIHGEMLAAAASNTPAGAETFVIRVELPDYALREAGCDDHVRAHHDLVQALDEYTAGFLAAT